ncbi:MAG TPA: cell division protein ZapA [Bacteroidales bacterium]|nr:cell division protein ZapA [Bacteroidales bacterium]HPS17125.1 cell division protein ZapA [Bacteroidales bacterium]
MSNLTVTVTIAERPYRLKIKAEEEEAVRKAVKLINEKIKTYADTYAYKDKQDLLAMVTLQFATYVVNYEESSKINDDHVINKLCELDKILTDCLNIA